MLGDKLLFSAMILIPLMITIAAGYSFRYEKLDIIPVAMVDEDESEYSKLLLERLTGKEGLALIMADRQTAAASRRPRPVAWSSQVAECAWCPPWC